MCYSAQIAAKARIIASRSGRPYEEVLRRIGDLTMKRWTSAFGRPSLPLLQDGGQATLARWTFLAPWIRDEAEAAAQTAKTGNCRAEEMFDKPTFREAARLRRAVLPLEAYFEYQHRGKAKVPFRFYRPDGEIFYVGGVWQEWHGQTTFAVCTMPPNRLARWIHNNPQAYSGPRQPVLLRDDDEVRQWLAGGGPESIEALLRVRDDGFLVAEVTEGPSGEAPASLPPEPEGRPPEVVVRGQLDLF